MLRELENYAGSVSGASTGLGGCMATFAERALDDRLRQFMTKVDKLMAVAGDFTDPASAPVNAIVCNIQTLAGIGELDLDNALTITDGLLRTLNRKDAHAAA